MKRSLVLTVLLSLLLTAVPLNAATTDYSPDEPTGYKIYLPLCMVRPNSTLYVDDDGVCNGMAPCYAHPQDAVNAALPGDHIVVYPGAYGSRLVSCAWQPNCSENDSYAPALIIYKNNLTISAFDSDPTKTVIETTHHMWSNPGAIAESTAGGVKTVSGAEPHTVSIIASGVTLSGFTLRRECDESAGGHSAVFIGGLYVGYGLHGETLGYGNNTVAGNRVDGGPGHRAGSVSIWHSSDNVVRANRIVDPNFNAIQVHDGLTVAEVGLSSPSRRNLVEGNIVSDDPATSFVNNTCVFVGAWTEGSSTPRTDNNGTVVQRNRCGNKGLATTVSDGAKMFKNNTEVDWICRQHTTGASFEGNTGRYPIDQTNIKGCSLP